MVLIDKDKSGVTIAHQTIQGYMPAMTMHFKAADRAASRSDSYLVKKGDSLKDLHLVESVRKEALSIVGRMSAWEQVEERISTRLGQRR